ncbi:MMPL family transporter [Streptomyces stelliscabiei]|uniref:MMPL family transporter n=1 Tax=Streptomyces stelliscabiei TaxID=146820 RepID=UPI003A919E13
MPLYWVRLPGRAGRRLQHRPDVPGPREALLHGTRQGVLRGLVSTGGVITSAGVVLAATFAALGVIPLASSPRSPSSWPSASILDTRVVRSLLVPTLVRGPSASAPGGRRAWGRAGQRHT